MRAQELLPLALLAVAFWLLVIRPTQRQRAAKAAIVASVAPGAEVVTAGGMRGVVVSLEEDDVVLEVSDGVHVRFLRSAIAGVKRPQSPDDPGPTEPSTTDSSDPSEPTT